MASSMSALMRRRRSGPWTPKLARFAGVTPDLASFRTLRLGADTCTRLRWMVTSMRSRQIVSGHARPHGRCRSAHWEQTRSEEHTSELQSQSNIVCRLLLEKKKKKTTENN